MNKTVSLKDFAKVLDKEINNQVKDVQKAAAKALNSSARKARTAVAKLEAKTLGFKTKRFAKAIEIKKATKDDLNATVSFPNNASEVQNNGKTYLMIPIKGNLKKIGYGEDDIKRGMANDLLKYAHEHPKRTKKKVEKPQPFFKLKNDKNQFFISARKEDNRKKMNWFYVGKEGHEPDFVGIVQKTVNENLEKDFERELKKAIDKNK